jgi:hypothetical protein
VGMWKSLAISKDGGKGGNPAVRTEGRGFHEKAGLVNIFFLTRPQISPPTSGRRLALSAFAFPSKKGFCFSAARHALLPFALLLELAAPVPVGVLIFETGAAISVPN